MTLTYFCFIAFAVVKLERGWVGVFSALLARCTLGRVFFPFCTVFGLVRKLKKQELFFFFFHCEEKRWSLAWNWHRMSVNWVTEAHRAQKRTCTLHPPWHFWQMSVKWNIYYAQSSVCGLGLGAEKCEKWQI